MAGFNNDGIIGTRKEIESAQYVTNSTERLALVPTRDGQLVVQIDTNELYSWDAGTSSWVEVAGGSLSASDIDDTNTVDLTLTLGVLTADLNYQDSNSANLSDDGSGLKVDVVIQDTNSIDLSEDASGIKADLNIQDSNSIDLTIDSSGLKADIITQNSTSVDFSVDGSGLKADVDASGVDHNSLSNTHNLSTDIDHDGLTNTHNLTTSIDHDSITNAHNLSTDIDHDGLTNTHNLTTDIDHNSITNSHNLSTDIDHDGLTNTHNLTTDIDHDSLTNFSADEHFTQASISIPASQISDFDTEVSNNSTVTGKQDNVITTRGDIIRGSSAAAAERLALGNADQVLTSDGTDIAWADVAGGNEIKETQATHGFSVLDPIYHDGSDWALAKADAGATVATHVVKAVVDANTFKAIQFGRITSTSHGLTPGDYYWLDIDTAGNAVTTEPTSGYSCPLYYVLDANNVICMVYRPSAIGGGITSDSEIGSIVAFGCSTAPVGFLACEGQAVSRSTYADLFDVISTTWGVGDGSTTFNIPDLRGAFLRGTGSHGTANMADGNDFAGPALGASENDQFQGHIHKIDVSGTDDGNYTRTGASINAQRSTLATLYTDGTNGDPRYGDETRPFNYGVKFCIRYAAKGALQGSDYYNQTVILKDVKATTTDGGTSSNTTWNDRVLNTTENTQSWCSLASNQFTLSAGTYKIKASAPSFQSVRHRIRIYNISDSSRELLGSVSYTLSTDAVQTDALLTGIISITSSKIFKLQHYTQTGQAGTGLGASCDDGDEEIYSIVEIEKIGD